MKRQITLGELAKLIQGIPYGDAQFCITGVASIEDADSNDITFAENQRFLKAAINSKAGAIIGKPGYDFLGKPGIFIDNPRLAFAKALRIFAPDIPGPSVGIHKMSFIDEYAIIGENVCIGPNVIIKTGAVLGDKVILYPGVYVGKDVQIGMGTVIYPNVVIREDTIIGKDVIIHGGAIIGADGFGFVTSENKHYKIPQIGTVIIGDNVEIGANTCIDRGTTGATVIGRGTKIDNLVQIGHNVKIGEDCIIIGQTGIGGSAEIGENTIISGQVGIKDHVKIGSGSIIAGVSLVATNVPPKSFISGNPARPHKDQLRTEVSLRKLPEALKRLKTLEKKLDNIQVDTST